jgi:hypothetical protein
VNAAVAALVDQRDRLDGQITAAKQEIDRQKRRLTACQNDVEVYVRERGELQAAIDQLAGESAGATTTKE